MAPRPSSLKRVVCDKAGARPPVRGRQLDEQQPQFVRQGTLRQVRWHGRRGQEKPHVGRCSPCESDAGPNVTGLRNLAELSVGQVPQVCQRPHSIQAHLAAVGACPRQVVPVAVCSTPEDGGPAARRRGLHRRSGLCEINVRRVVRCTGHLILKCCSVNHVSSPKSSSNAASNDALPICCPHTAWEQTPHIRTARTHSARSTASITYYYTHRPGAK